MPNAENPMLEKHKDELTEIRDDFASFQRVVRAGKFGLVEAPFMRYPVSAELADDLRTPFWHRIFRQSSNERLEAVGRFVGATAAPHIQRRSLWPGAGYWLVVRRRNKHNPATLKNA